MTTKTKNFGMKGKQKSTPRIPKMTMRPKAGGRKRY
jgi:hypothetical protein